MNRDKLIYCLAGVMAIIIVTLGAWMHAESQTLQREITDRKRADLELSAAVRHAKASAAEASDKVDARSAELVGYIADDIKANTERSAQFREAINILQSQIDKLATVVLAKDTDAKK